MTAPRGPRVYLSPPHLGDDERALVQDAFDSNWIAPLGPHVDAFEREFAARVGVAHACATSSGTAALHLALRLLGVQRGDEVLCSALTFCASANPILYEGATPVFVDASLDTWNVDPALVAAELDDAAGRGRLPKAAIVVDLYGQSADHDPIRAACARHGVPIVEDAAEALGATYRGRACGTQGAIGVFSFNGNKIITTSGGGMLVSDDADVVARARFLATQARDPAPHYEHSQLGFNYRLSNVCAAIGRGQLRVLDDRVAARRRVFEAYRRELAVDGVTFMPEAPYGRATRWLTVARIDAARFGASRDDVIAALAAHDVEARPVWKPLHRQPLYAGARVVGGAVSEALFADGVCLPSGSALTDDDVARIAGIVRAARR